MMVKTLNEKLSSKSLTYLFKNFEEIVRKEYKKSSGNNNKNNVDIYGKEMVAALFIDFIMTNETDDTIKKYPETYKQARKSFIDHAQSYVINAITQASNADITQQKMIHRLDSLTKLSKNTIGFNLESKISTYSPGLITELYNALDRKGLYDIGVMLTTDIFTERNTAKFKQYNILQTYLERL